MPQGTSHGQPCLGVVGHIGLGVHTDRPEYHVRSRGRPGEVGRNDWSQGGGLISRSGAPI